MEIMNRFFEQWTAFNVSLIATWLGLIGLGMMGMFDSAAKMLAKLPEGVLDMAWLTPLLAGCCGITALVLTAPSPVALKQVLVIPVLFGAVAMMGFSQAISAATKVRVADEQATVDAP